MSGTNISRHILASDDHKFVGRVYDLAMPVELNFNCYKQLEQFPDCFYVVTVDVALTTLVRRVESLNIVGNMLWPDEFPKSFSEFPVSRYEWLNIVVDVLLMRLISVMDCGLQLANEILECDLKPHQCTIEKFRRINTPKQVIKALEGILVAQGLLRKERNSRFHSGHQRDLSDDDPTFRTVSMHEQRGGIMIGTDAHGREIDLGRFFEDALVKLKSEFNSSTCALSVSLAEFYDEIGDEFEVRFRSKFRARTKTLPYP